SHDVGRSGGGLFCCHHQVPLMLAIGIVRYDHDFPGRDVGDDVVNRIELKRIRFRFGNHGTLIGYLPRRRSATLGRATLCRAKNEFRHSCTGLTASRPTDLRSSRQSPPADTYRDYSLETPLSV